MRYSHKQLLKLRSGQCVWRVLIRVGQDGNLVGDIERHAILGKKTTHWFPLADKKKGWASILMKCMRVEAEKLQPYSHKENRETVARFLGDLAGDGAFSTRKHAERYVAEVLAGLHPEVEERIRWQDEMDRELDKYIRDWDDGPIYTGESDDDLIPVEVDDFVPEIDSSEHGHPLDIEDRRSPFMEI